MQTYILYHGNCFDGFGSAFAAWKRFGTDAIYIPCVYGTPLPEIPEGSSVYMIDFSLKRDEMLALKARCENLVVLDHHKTAEESLKGLDFAHFDMTKSGALLAWEHFFPGEEVPLLIQYVSDHDLWKHALPRSHEVHAGLAAYPFDFEVWDKLDFFKLISEGTTLLKYRDVLINMIMQQAREVSLGGYTIMAVNSTSHWSEIGNQMCKKYPESPFCASFYYDKFGNKKWSLRSIGDFDVSDVAKSFGGGGHKNAAGFEEKL